MAYSLVIAGVGSGSFPEHKKYFALFWVRLEEILHFLFMNINSKIGKALIKIK